MKRLLLLEDGSVFEGEAFGADVETSGEIVFSTGMTGYQESITDQSYNGQIITLNFRYRYSSINKNYSKTWNNESLFNKRGKFYS